MQELPFFSFNIAYETLDDCCVTVVALVFLFWLTFNSAFCTNTFNDVFPLILFYPSDDITCITVVKDIWHDVSMGERCQLLCNDERSDDDKNKRTTF